PFLGACHIVADMHIGAFEDLTARPCIPEPHGPIGASRGDPLPVGAEHGADRDAAVALHDSRLIPCLPVPEPPCALLTRGDDPLPIGTESDVVDSGCVAPEGLQ